MLYEKQTIHGVIEKWLVYPGMYMDKAILLQNIRETESFK